MKSIAAALLLGLLCIARPGVADRSIATLATTAEQTSGATQDRATREQELAQLNAAVKASAEDYRGRPKRQFISASTREPEYISYLDEWVRHIEFIGNREYPAEARSQGLSGELLLVVEIGRNGELLQSEIVVSSGSAVLDLAALTITRRASPFKPIPIIDGVDILNITRTWKFVAKDVTDPSQSPVIRVAD